MTRIIFPFIILCLSVGCEESGPGSVLMAEGFRPPDQGMTNPDVVVFDMGVDTLISPDALPRDASVPMDRTIDIGESDLAVIADMSMDSRPDVLQELVDASQRNDAERQRRDQGIAPARCGDGRVDPGESCDDSNELNGDGCDATCSREETQILKSAASLSETTAAGSFDNFHFVADGDGHIAFRITSDGRCQGDEDIRSSLRLEGQVEPARLMLVMAEEGECPWWHAPVRQGQHTIQVAPAGENRGVTFTLEFRHQRHITLSQTYDGAIAEGGDDRYMLVLEAPRLVRFETTGLDGWCAANTWMTLFIERDGLLEELDFDAGGAGGGCSRLQRQLPAGRFNIVVRELFRGAIEGYRLMVMTTGECGDSILNIEEECDDGNIVDGDGCTPDCLGQAVCGNGEIEIGETCDDNNQESGDGCDELCQQEPPCGNGRLDPEEQCDDGNEENFDGCDQLCSLEEFWISVGQGRFPGRLAVGADDIFYFTADGPSRLDVSVRDDEFGCRPSADSHIALFGRDQDGDPVFLLENDDDPANPPCSRLNVDVGVGEHHIAVSETNDRLSIDQYTLLFRLTRDVTNLPQVAGAFPPAGSDRYTFTLNQRTALRVGLSEVAGGCRDALRVQVLNEHAVRPLAFEPVIGEDCGAIGGVLAPGRYDLNVTTTDQSAVASYRLRMEWRAP